MVHYCNPPSGGIVGAAGIEFHRVRLDGHKLLLGKEVGNNVDVCLPSGNVGRGDVLQRCEVRLHAKGTSVAFAGSAEN